eukprot:6521041-Lingulodinium_polyedra.AAC.1
MSVAGQAEAILGPGRRWQLERGLAPGGAVRDSGRAPALSAVRGEVPRARLGPPAPDAVARGDRQQP